MAYKKSELISYDKAVSSAKSLNRELPDVSKILTWNLFEKCLLQDENSEFWKSKDVEVNFPHVRFTIFQGSDYSFYVTNTSVYSLITNSLIKDEDWL